MPYGTSACFIGAVEGVGVGRDVKKLAQVLMREVVIYLSRFALELCNRKEKKNEMTATSQG